MKLTDTHKVGLTPKRLSADPLIHEGQISTAQAAASFFFFLNYSDRNARLVES